MKNKWIPQFFLYQVRKSTTLIDLSICQEIRFLGNFLLHSQEDSFHNVFHVNKSQVLAPESH